MKPALEKLEHHRVLKIYILSQSAGEFVQSASDLFFCLLSLLKIGFHFPADDIEAGLGTDVRGLELSDIRKNNFEIVQY